MTRFESGLFVRVKTVHGHNPSDGSWQIKILVDNHTCARKRKNRAATLEWTVNKLYPKLRKHPKMKHREIWGTILAPAGMPCMHAISAIQEKNDKRPEEYYHEWLTMEAYRRTYQFNVNPIKGQDLWEKTGSPAPVPLPIKRKPGRPTTNRRKDKAEGSTGTKTKMKRKYAPIRCMYCGELGYNKRTCSKKKQDNAQEKARTMQLQFVAVQPPQPAPGLEAEK
ncbi:hypothetical protein Ahy_A01g002866 [Arachis hypogaea]|uniref:CCHC-type domain-containing protein n=1 Tax=Arachis hypogaea TaxID=3818 RepID=A0A445ERM2_ARAHY|nr:hypothetical protein Ahy_A01g002866 [Arachis hypogaea]